MPDKKDEVVNMLRELMELTVLDEANPQSFRARAYENAMHELKGLGEDITAMKVSELMKLPGIGKSTAQKIRQYLDEGQVDKLEALREKYPPAFQELARIPGLGPKTLHRLRKELSIETVADLKAAIAQQKLRELKGLGAKVEQNLTKSIERLGLHGKDRRRPLAEAVPVAESLVERLSQLPAASKVQYCGSLRRMRETIADVDIVVATDDAAAIMEAFSAFPEVKEIIARGDTKTSILVDDELQVDLRAVAPKQFGAAIQYFTGSKAHNIKVRQLAIQNGWTLNEYGLTDVETGDVVAAATEEEIYKALGLAWVPPSLREDLGEVEAAADNSLPTIAPPKGRLRVTTAGTSLADIVKTKDPYVGIADPGPSLPVYGLTAHALAAQKDELAKLSHKVHVFHSVVAGVDESGALDLTDDELAGFDFVQAHPHAGFHLDKDTQTKRVLTAMAHKQVRILVGLTSKLDVDVDAVLEHAEKTNTAIEIDGSLSALSPAADVLQRARRRDVLFVLHAPDWKWGIAHALRGWVPGERILNTWPLERLKEHFA